MDNGSVGLSEGVQMKVPPREAKSGEKRWRENKKRLEATVSLRRK